MRLRHLVAPCVGLLLGAALAVRSAPAEDSARADEEKLRTAGVATDGPGLIAYLRKRTVEIDESHLEELVARLGADDFFAREKASEQLVALGVRAKPALKEAVSSRDPEVVWRARRCLGRIDQGGASEVLIAVVRTLARKDPPGTLEALLSYLVAADDAVAAEVRQAIGRLAGKRDKPPEVLVKALADKASVRRAAAGMALCRFPDQLPAVAKLLDDPEPEVRLHVGLALAAAEAKSPKAIAQRKKAVPALIGLLAEPRFARRSLVQEFLSRLAEGADPEFPEDDSPAELGKYRDAWAKWWKEKGDKVGADALAQATHLLGHTLVVLLDRNEILLLDPANRPRWKMEGVQFPLDVELLPGERVLIAEYNANRVTERDRTGKVLWEFEIKEPLVAQRLPGGNTFIAGKERTIEVDKKGKEVSSFRPLNGATIMRARRLPGGEIALVTQLGVSRFSLIDKDGKEVRSFGVNVSTSGGRIDVLPGGNVLVPEMYNDRVVEYSPEGKIVREVHVEQPIVASILPNGNLLVTSMAQNRAIEFTRKGREVWQFKADTRVTRAVRQWVR
jgi:hypothetical protein